MLALGGAAAASFYGHLLVRRANKAHDLINVFLFAIRAMRWKHCPRGEELGFTITAGVAVGIRIQSGFLGGFVAASQAKSEQTDQQSTKPPAFCG
ncbi:MAG: hypothetical protein AAB370_08815 [Verrucomicrobiota bacterium]